MRGWADRRSARMWAEAHMRDRRSSSVSRPRWRSQATKAPGTAPDEAAARVRRGVCVAEHAVVVHVAHRRNEALVDAQAVPRDVGHLVRLFRIEIRKILLLKNCGKQKLRKLAYHKAEREYDETKRVL